MTFYHGTEHEFAIGEFVEPGHISHVSTGNPDGLVWFSEHEEFAEFWGDELREGDSYYVYEVVPQGPYEPDRGVATGQVLEGNYQSRFSLLVVDEVP